MQHCMWDQVWIACVCHSLGLADTEQQLVEAVKQCTALPDTRHSGWIVAACLHISALLEHTQCASRDKRVPQQLGLCKASMYAGRRLATDLAGWC